MEFRDIEYFAVLAQHGHVGRAAEALNLSQPALSLSLRRLETAMQTKLVKRTPKGVELTATGTALLARVQRLRLAREDVLREVADLSQGRSGILRIGAHPGVMTFPLAPACAELLKDAADLELVVTAMTSGLLPALRSGELDLIVHDAVPSQDDLVHEHLLDDAFVTFVAANHRLARRKQVSIRDLAQERWARSGISARWDVFVEASLAAGNPAPRTGIRTDSSPLRDYLVANAGLLGYSTRLTLKEVASQYRVAEIKVKELERIRRVHVSYRKDGYLSPAGRRLIEILKATVKKNSADLKR
ncbi:MAG: LysR family transcriptional regulator [Betaproteobacteria bacterium]|nr:LysR family transcriptional regulator [Betaproteobacteria bacterium]